MNSPSVAAHISLAMALLWTYTTFTWVYNFSVFGQIEKFLNGQNYFEDIYIKFKKTELVEIS